MAVMRKMLPGYNHNVCYKGQIFHIQTEDSGIDHPHIITLLFVKGNIIGRKKRDYSDAVGFDRMEEVVRELMQEQHKAMLRDLVSGKYDAYLGGTPPPSAEALAACPEPAPGPTKPAAPARPTPPPATPAAKPTPPPPATSQEFREKPAQKTITLQANTELKDEEIFGADLISDKSLDEVVLSFLAKQLDEDEEK